jgi:hypothetical protein
MDNENKKESEESKDFKIPNDNKMNKRSILYFYNYKFLFRQPYK